MTGPAEGGPTVRRIVLGNQLRRLREARSISREAAGEVIRGSESKISRMELGRVSLKERDITDLLGLYGVEDEQERETLLVMARHANEAGWWHSYGELVPSWFQNYVGLEEAATRIQTYEVRMIPGLLQTGDYAWWVVKQGLPEASDAEVHHRTRLRLDRQKVLDTAKVWAVIDEAALHRIIGNPEVMREQLRHLLRLIEDNAITFQIVPFSVGNYSAENAFTLLRFAETELPDIVYLEYLNGSLYLDKRSAVELYAKVTHRLAVEADTPENSADRLSRRISTL